MSTIVSEISTQEEWDSHILAHPNAHPLQLWGWGEVKRGNGWQVFRLVIAGESFVYLQVLTKQLAPGMIIAYVPRGPIGIGEMTDLQVNELRKFLRKRGVALLRIEPPVTSLAKNLGFTPSFDQILTDKTQLIPVLETHTQQLAIMKKAHRYSIRKAEEVKIVVQKLTSTTQLDELYMLYQSSAQRAAYTLHPQKYYESVYSNLGDANCIFLAYSAEGELVAFIWTVIAGKMAFDLYAGSSEEGRKGNANYALKSSLLEYLRKNNCETLDLNGLLHDSLRSFKQGFGGEAISYVGTFDLPIRLVPYGVIHYGLPLVRKARTTLIRLLHASRH